MKILIALLVVLTTVGCVNNTPVAGIPQEDPNSLARTCVSPNGQLMDEHYCDPVWVAQQQELARQRNDITLLNSLLLYHYVYGGSINNGYVTHYYTNVPSGYSYHPYNRNVTVNKTVVNNYHSNTTVNKPTTQSYATGRSQPSYSNPKPSYSGSSKSSFSSSGSYSRRK